MLQVPMSLLLKLVCNESERVYIIFHSRRMKIKGSVLDLWALQASGGFLPAISRAGREEEFVGKSGSPGSQAVPKRESPREGGINADVASRPPNRHQDRPGLLQ